MAEPLAEQNTENGDDEQKSYCCFTCEKSFSEKRNYERHQQRVHQLRKIYCCKLCPNKYNNYRQYKRHIFLHNREIFFECSICKTKFSRKEHVEKHLSSVHQIYRVQCQLCEKGFPFKYEGVDHLREQHGDMDFSNCSVMDDKNEIIRLDFPCNECNETFITRDDLKKHKDENHNDKPLIMNRSLRRLSLRRVIKRKSVVKELPKNINSNSKKSESNREKYMCDKCGTAYTSNYNLKRHQKSYFHKQSLKNVNLKVKTKSLVSELAKKITNRSKIQNQVKKPCSECGKLFSSKWHLDRHFRIHSQNTKPQKTKMRLRTRSENMTLNSDPLPVSPVNSKKKICTICKISFDGTYKLNEHLNTHIKEGVLAFSPNNSVESKPNDFAKANNVQIKLVDNIDAKVVEIIAKANLETPRNLNITLPELTIYKVTQSTNKNSASPNAIKSKPATRNSASPNALKSKLTTKRSASPNGLKIKSKPTTKNSDSPNAIKSKPSSGNSVSPNAIKSQPLQCKICKARYTRKRDFDHHVESKHFNKCVFCSRTFSEKRYLQDHMRSNHANKTYICEICDKVFLHPHHLEQHVQYVHEKNFPHGKQSSSSSSSSAADSKKQCKTCLKIFSSPSVLRRHRVNIHNENY